jgi:phosphoribosylformylglycinamidine synthase subunit PurL
MDYLQKPFFEASYGLPYLLNLCIQIVTKTIATTFSPAEIKAEGLTLDEYAMICDRLGRAPNKADVEA